MTKTKAKPRTKPKPTTPEGPMPVGANVLMAPDDITTALRISARERRKMVACGMYPPPDLYLNGSARLPRWRVETHNQWLQSQGEKRG